MKIQIKYVGTKWLNPEEIWMVVFEAIRDDPDRIRKIVDIISEHGGKTRCPFPGLCKYFPCETLSCNNDSLNNGYPCRGY